MIELKIEDPLVKEPQLLGQIDRSKMLERFAHFDWAAMNRKLEENDADEFFHSPTMYFKDRKNDTEICFSLLGRTVEYDFLVFYVRKKMARGLFGIGKREKKVVSDIEYTFSNCKIILEEYVNMDGDALEKRF